MNKGKVKWVFVAPVVILVLVLIIPNRFTRPTTRAQRIKAVNNVSGFSATSSSSIIWPSTNALSAVMSNQ